MNPKVLRQLLLALGLLGVAMCLVSGLARLGGAYLVGGISAQAVMMAGIALMVAAVFGKQFFVDD